MESAVVYEENLAHLTSGFIPNIIPEGLFKDIFNKKILKNALNKLDQNITKNKKCPNKPFVTAINEVLYASNSKCIKGYNNYGGTECISFFAYKKDGNTRNMGIINPKLYTVFVRNLLIVKDEWLKEIYYDEDNLNIINHSNSPILLFKNSESWVNNIANNYPDALFNLKDKGFRRNIKNSRKTEGVYTKYLETDFESFYDNIYTHKLENLRDYSPYKEFKVEYPSIDDFFDFLDRFNRNANKNQTKGIVQGPVSSAISAELLSIAIDFSLFNECKDSDEFNEVNYIRYVDDHTFFSNNIGHLEWIKKRLNKVIKKFKLNLKAEKTVIEPGFKDFKEANLNHIMLNCPFLDKKSKRGISCSNLIDQFMKYAYELENKKDFSQLKALISLSINKINKNGIYINSDMVEIVIPYILKLSFIDPYLASNCYSLIEVIIKKLNEQIITSSKKISKILRLKKEILSYLIYNLTFVNKEFYETNIQIWHYYLIGKYAYNDQRNKVLKELLDKCNHEHYSCDSLLILPFIKKNLDSNKDIFNHIKQTYWDEFKKNGNSKNNLLGISESRWWPTILSLCNYINWYKSEYKNKKNELKKIRDMEQEIKQLFQNNIKEFQLFIKI